jgi:hypothetical protein
VYPGGVPFPEELHAMTAVIANEVWLYVDDDGDVLGAYWWPDAIRRPIASIPREEFAAEQVVDASDLASRLDFAPRLPEPASWTPAQAVCFGRDEVLVFFVRSTLPDPLHEMLVYEQGGLSLRARKDAQPADVEEFLRSHQPPYRRVRAGTMRGVGRDPGRALGPQTWPWPGELRWWDDGVSYELKGFVPLTQLQAIAGS